jgi:hypothetical protein
MEGLGRLMGMTLVLTLLAAFFIWVMVEMASFSHGDGRLEALATGLGIGTVGSGIVYALTGRWLGRR